MTPWNEFDGNDNASAGNCSMEDINGYDFIVNSEYILGTGTRHASLTQPVLTRHFLGSS